MNKPQIRQRTANGEWGEWRDVRTLEELKPLINEAFEKARQAERKAVEPFETKLGKILLEAFPQVGYRKWEKWLRKNLNMTTWDADRCMKVAAQDKKGEH